MKLLISVFITLLLLILSACGSKNQDTPVPFPALPLPPPEVLDPVPTPSPTPAPTATPLPTPSSTPTPPPLAYDCENHPLTENTYTHSQDNYSVAFRDDCTYTFTDASHISFGIWSPDPNPEHVTLNGQVLSYPMTFTPTGSYICLPANGPQNCFNYGFAGSVLVTVDRYNPTINLIIISN